MDDLSAAKLEDVKEWFKTYYGPTNAVLVARRRRRPGARPRQKVEKYFGDIPPGPPVARFEAWVAKRTGTQRASGRRTACRRRASSRSGTCPGCGHGRRRLPGPGRAACSPTGKTSRLYKRLVYDDQIATGVQRLRRRARDRQPVHASRPTPSRTATWPRSRRRIDEELARLLEDGPDRRRAGARAHADAAPASSAAVERIGGFGGKSDVLARGHGLRAATPDAYKAALERVRTATPAAAARGGAALAVRRRLRARDHARSPSTAADGQRRRSHEAARGRDAAPASLPEGREGHAVERHEGRAGRAHAIPVVELQPAARRRLRRRSVRHARHRHAWPWRCSTRARKPERAADQR